MTEIYSSVSNVWTELAGLPAASPLMGCCLIKIGTNDVMITGGSQGLIKKVQVGYDRKKDTMDRMVFHFRRPSVIIAPADQTHGQRTLIWAKLGSGKDVEFTGAPPTWNSTLWWSEGDSR